MVNCVITFCSNNSAISENIVVSLLIYILELSATQLWYPAISRNWIFHHQKALQETRIALWVTNFCCAFFSLHIEKFQLFCRFQNIPTEKYENSQDNCMIFLCVTKDTRKNIHSQKNWNYSMGFYKTHRKKLYTHGKKQNYSVGFVLHTD